MSDLDEARSHDPGRGFFCATTKSGEPQPFPPTRRQPRPDREKNPRGVMRPFKSHQDRLPVKERKRYQDWLKRGGRA